MKQIDTSTPIVIYGAGNCGRSTLRLLRVLGYNVRGFLDRNVPANAAVLGAPCLHPDDAEVENWKKDGAVLVVGIWNPEVDLSLLARELESQNWSRVLLFPEICDLWDAPIEPYWAAPRAFYESSEVQTEIAAAQELWDDETSRAIFQASLEARRNLNLEPLNQIAREQNGAQYFPNTIPDWPSPKRFVDCGAFDGDTLKNLPPSVEAVLAFEPDAKNFQLLARAAKIADVKTFLWPCGVWNETTTLHFQSGDGAASRLAENAAENSGVAVVSLDDVAPHFAPDMIKMDIEGAEIQALLGARATIEKYNPALAICVYHRPDHLWKIPLLISQTFGPCKMYLRAHAFNGFDTVLYCLPISAMPA